MHLLSFHRRIVSAGLLLMVIDWIFENCYRYVIVFYRSISFLLIFVGEYFGAGNEQMDNL